MHAHVCVHVYVCICACMYVCSQAIELDDAHQLEPAEGLEHSREPQLRGVDARVRLALPIYVYAYICNMHRCIYTYYIDTGIYTSIQI